MKKLFLAITAFVLSTAILGGCSGGNAPTLGNTNSLLVQPSDHAATTIPPELLALRFDGYEDLSISEYQAKAFDVIAENEAEYLSLIERVKSDSAIYDMRYTNEDAYFATNILIPTIAEKWNTWRFNNSCTGGDYLAEYSICYTIHNADNITMGKRNEAVRSIMDGVGEVLKSRTSEQLADEAGTQAALEKEIKELIGQYTTDDFQIEADLLYRAKDTTPSEITGYYTVTEGQGGIGTEADYQLLLSLKTEGYKELSASGFLQSYAELAQTPGFADAYARVSRDIACNDVRIDVTAEELDFLKVTLEATSQEFLAKYQNDNGLSTLRYRIERQISDTAKGQDISVFELLIDYNITYPVPGNTSEPTVGERDTALFAIKNSVENFVGSRTIDELANGKSELEAEMERLEQHYSSSKMPTAINIISYQAFDQRDEIQSLQ